MITSDVATGPFTVECTSIAVTQEDGRNTVPDTNGFEEPMTSTLVTEQLEVPHPLGMPDVSSVPSSPNCTLQNPVDRFLVFNWKSLAQG